MMYRAGFKTLCTIESVCRQGLEVGGDVVAIRCLLLAQEYTACRQQCVEITQAQMSNMPSTLAQLKTYSSNFPLLTLALNRTSFTNLFMNCTKSFSLSSSG